MSLEFPFKDPDVPTEPMLPEDRLNEICKSLPNSRKHFIFIV